MKKLFLLISLLFSAAISIARAAPANDNFANRAGMGVGTLSLDIKTATVEAGEPYTTEGRTVWYTYTATSDSIITLDDTGTGFGRAFMSIYMGSSINTMTVVKSDENGSTSVNVNRLSFKAKAGAIFQFCFGQTYLSSSATLPLQITLTTTPFVYSGALYGPETPSSPSVSNDYFSNRKTIAGNSITAINYMRDAGVEAGEPDTTSGHTVWYSWTATSDSIVTIGDTGTNYGRNFISIYMGDSVNNLILIDSDYNGSTSYGLSSVVFKAKAGTTFQICSGQSYSSENDNNFLQLNLSTVAFAHAGTLYGPEVPSAPTPKNDSFYTPQVLAGDLFTVIGSAASATVEPGDGFEKTLWYSWTATANKLVRVDFPADSSGGFLAFTGNSTQTIVEVTERPESTPFSHSFNAIAGTTYKLVIGSTYAPFQFTLTASDPPVNHGPVSKITFPKKGQTVSRSGFNFDGVFSDVDGDNIIAYQFKINGKTVVTNPHPSNESVFSGRLKKGKLTLQMRAKDSQGKWGPYHTIKVTAK